MKRSLFRHEYLRTRGSLTTLFVACAALVSAGALFMTTPVPILEAGGMILCVITGFIFLPAVTLGLAIDYWRSAYGRGGYLTQSVPVSGSTVYGVRLAYGAAALLVAMFANVLLAAPPVLVTAVKEAPEGVGAIEFIRQGLAATEPPMTPVLAAMGAAFIFVSAFGYLVLSYFAASYGSEERLGRLGVAGPIIVWLVVYVLVQVACVIGIALIPLGADYIDGAFTFISRDWFTVLLNNDQQVSGAPLGFVPVLVAAALLQIWRTAHSWNHKVSLR